MISLNKISTKIKLLGALLIALMVSVISTTIYLNQQNIKDALVVNIVGKQRMLTQKISKNVFYLITSA
jgi:nitrate/nitrite-specific signal transduction histidine kinase